MNKADIQTPASPPAPGPIEEHHYRVKELAKLWNMSTDTIRRLFRNEPGVVMLGRGKKGHQREYHIMLIPKAVAERVYRRSTLGGKVGG